jgi:hypothetical protein
MRQKVFLLAVVPLLLGVAHVLAIWWLDKFETHADSFGNLVQTTITFVGVNSMGLTLYECLTQGERYKEWVVQNADAVLMATIVLSGITLAAAVFFSILPELARLTAT